MLRVTAVATWCSGLVPWVVWLELGSLSSTSEQDKKIPTSRNGGISVLLAGRLRFPRKGTQGYCSCVLSPVGWRGGCASEQSKRFPSDPFETFQPQSLWKRRAELLWWEHRTIQGPMDTESHLDATSRAVSLKTNSQISFLGVGGKNREGSLRSALFQGSRLAGSCSDPGESRLTSD